MEVFLKGELRPVLADGRAHGIALRLIGRVFLGVHQTRVAEQMRRQIRMILARIRHRDLEAGDVIFLQGRDEVHARVLDEHIVRQVELVDIARLDRIAQAGDGAHIGRGVVVVDLKLFTAVAQKLHGRGLLVKLGIFEKALELRALRFAHVRILERRRGRDRQLVDIRVAAADDGARKAQQDAVRVVLLEEVVGVKDEVIAARVRHKHTAVAVEDAAARGRHGLGAGDAVAVFLIVRLTVDDLQFVERDHEHDHEQHEHTRERGDAAGLDGFFHSEDPFGGTGALNASALGTPAVKRTADVVVRHGEREREHALPQCHGEQPPERRTVEDPQAEHLAEGREQKCSQTRHEKREDPVIDEICREHPRAEADEREEHGKQQPRFGVAHGAEIARDEAEDRAPCAALEHADRHDDRRHEHGVHAEERNVRKDRGLQCNGHRHVQRAPEHAVYLFLVDQIRPHVSSPRQSP